MKKIFLLWAVIIIIAPACERFDHYDAPDWLQGPLFEQIKSTGEFDAFVKAAELSGYDEYLSSRLNFTVFVPTNEAFTEYYSEMGVSGPEELGQEKLLTLLQYHTLQNAWDSLKMGGKTSFGWWSTNPQNFRTPSVYIPSVRKEKGYDVYFDNTFVHTFSTPFFAVNNYNAQDYESFFPGSTWTGYHIDRAAILEKELGAENGFYYVINRVLHPRTTADEMIASREEFSLFNILLDIFVRYDLNQARSSASAEYEALYKKSYALNFNLANEKIPTNAYDGYYQVMNTVFVPSNQAIIDYFATTFPAYPTMQDVPLIIIKYFLEAHLVPNKKLFPSVLERTDREVNDFSDPIPFSLNNGINHQAISSNALIYGVDEVIHSNAFSTISGPIIGNPEYRIFTMMLELSGEIRSFFKQEIGHTAFVLSDELMAQLGFAYDEGDPVDFTDDRIFRNNSQLTVAQMRSFLENFISITSKPVDGQREVHIRTKNNKFLRVGNGKIQGLFGEASIKQVYETTNGTVIEIDKDLTSNAVYTIENFLNDNKERFSRFFALAESAGMLDANGDIGTMSVFSGITMLVPTNEAIEAISGTYIPENPTEADFNIRNFIAYHVISERTMFTDDSFPAGNYGTDLFLNTVRQRINAIALDGQIRVTDIRGNTQIITPGENSNIITTNGVIHIVNQAVQH